MTERRCQRIQVWGRVQGVGFRAAARSRAAQLGVATTAENQADGSVIMIAEGDRNALAEFVAWAGVGPRLAGVTRIEVIDLEPSGGPDTTR